MCLAGNYCDSDKSFAYPGVFLTIFRKDAALKVSVIQVNLVMCKSVKTLQSLNNGVLSTGLWLRRHWVRDLSATPFLHYGHAAANAVDISVRVFSQFSARSRATCSGDTLRALASSSTVLIRSAMVATALSMSA